MSAGPVYFNGDPRRHTTFRLTAPEGVDLLGRKWQATRPRAVLCYLHGMGDHSGTFAALGERLSEAGITCYAHDHRGFGGSGGPRGDVGSLDTLVGDASLVLHRARDENPTLPTFIAGLSMGGALALRLAAREPRVAGVIALAPGLKLRHPPSPGMLARVLWSLLVSPARRIASPFPVTWTTNNPEALAAIQADPQWLRVFTARFYWATLQSSRRLWPELQKVRVPSLFVVAGEDRVVDNRAVRAGFGLVPCPDKTYRQINGAWHNLVVDPLREEVAAAVRDWIWVRLERLTPSEREA